jgi:S1-C subfamily serine protease
MTLRTWPILLLVLAGCVGPPPVLDLPEVPVGEESAEPPTPAVTSVARRAQEVTVRIRALGCEQLGIGSGFVLPGGIIVTNRHVVGEPREVTVNTWDGRRFDAEVTGIALDSDLAILRIAEEVDLPVAELRTTPVERGEPVVVVGYPEGGPATVTTGQVVGLVSGELLGEPADVIRIDAEIRPGNSGGPVLDQDGRVIGIVFAHEPDAGTGLAVPVETLIARLDAAVLERPTGC